MSNRINQAQARWTQYKTEHATTLRVAKWSSLSLIVAAALLGAGAIAMRYGGHYQLNAAGFKQLGQDMGTLGPKMTRWWNSGRYSGGAMMATVAGTLGGVALIGAGVKYGPKAVKAIGKKTHTLRQKRATDTTSTLQTTQQSNVASEADPSANASSGSSSSGSVSGDSYSLSFNACELPAAEIKATSRPIDDVARQAIHQHNGSNIGVSYLNNSRSPFQELLNSLSFSDSEGNGDVEALMRRRHTRRRVKQQPKAANGNNPWADVLSSHSGSGSVSESLDPLFFTASEASEAAEEQASRESAGQSEGAPQRAARKNAPPMSSEATWKKHLETTLQRDMWTRSDRTQDPLMYSLAEGMPLSM